MAVAAHDPLAIDHKIHAACNFGPTIPECMTVGLGPQAFDCSGLVIAAIVQVMGYEPTAWPPERRHVRQMHPMAEPTDLREAEVGDLLTLGRLYTIQGITEVVPAHIGIVVARAESHVLFMHAQAAAGRILTSKLEYSNADRIGKLLGLINPLTMIS